MDNEKEPKENVPLVEFKDQNTIASGDENGVSEPPKSTSINDPEKNSESTTLDVTNDVLWVEKKAKQEHISIPSVDELNSWLPPAMQSSAVDMTNGAYGSNDDKKQGTSQDGVDGFNKYRNQKSFSQGMLDIALFTSNVNQLRSLTKNPPRSTIEFCFIIILLMSSILLQIAVGLMLLLSARYDVNKEEERKAVYTTGNYVVAGIFLITIFNLFIAVFYDYEGVAMPIMNA